MTERKAAIVTGSATGVGAATALALARRGYDVLINYSRSEREARESEAACREAGADTLLVCGDISDDAACRAMAEAAMGRWKRIDALVNNAGITSFAGSANWDALDAKTFQRILDVNVIGAFQMVRACVAHLKQSPNGSIVNVSSIAGALGIGSSLAYIASKGAVNAMTLNMARALAPEIRVNAVCPGMITTRWFVDGIGEENFREAEGAVRAVDAARPGLHGGGRGRGGAVADRRRPHGHGRTGAAGFGDAPRAALRRWCGGEVVVSAIWRAMAIISTRVRAAADGAGPVSRGRRAHRGCHRRAGAARADRGQAQRLYRPGAHLQLRWKDAAAMPGWPRQRMREVPYFAIFCE